MDEIRKIIIHLGGRKEISGRNIPNVPKLEYPELEGLLDLPKRIREFITQSKGDVVIVTTSDVVPYTLRIMAKQGQLENADVVLYDLDGKQFRMDKTDCLFSYYNEQGETNSRDANSICYKMIIELLEKE